MDSIKTKSKFLKKKCWVCHSKDSGLLQGFWSCELIGKYRFWKYYYICDVCGYEFYRYAIHK